MDSYTVLRTYANVLLKLWNEVAHDKYRVSCAEFNISPIISEVLQKSQQHRYVLLSNEGHLYGMDSVNAPIPEFFKGKRYMKTNPRAGIRDVIKVLYNLLGIQELDDQTVSLNEFVLILHFLLAFQLENDDSLSALPCDFSKYLRRQFFHGPSFFEDEKLWKRKYRDPAILSFYECGNQVESLGHNFRQKTEELNSLLESQASSIVSLRQALGSQKESCESLQQVVSSLNSDHGQLAILHNQVVDDHNALKETLSETKESLEKKVLENQNSLEEKVKITQEVLLDSQQSLSADLLDSQHLLEKTLEEKSQQLEQSIEQKSQQLQQGQQALEQSLDQKSQKLEKDQQTLEQILQQLEQGQESLEKNSVQLEKEHQSLEQKSQLLEQK